MGTEWVGGILTPPFFVTDRDDPYRISLATWLELPDGFVVGQSVVPPEDVPGALGRTLAAALAQPMIGKPRRPERIRVADDAVAAEVREAIGDGVPIDVAPTPELDEVLEFLLDQARVGDEDASYLEDGRVSPETVARLFAAAEVLYRLAPWKVATDGHVLRMDVPALGVVGACVSIIGNLGEAFGILVFPSLEAFEGFAQAAEEAELAGTRPDLGTDWLGLAFERGADLPPSMRREIAANGWPVAAPDAYPHVEHFDRDGASRPLVARDVEIMTACASALAAFFVKHREIFEADEIEPVCESWSAADELEVRFTAPYEAFELFDVDAAGGAENAPGEPPRSRVGRNDPCPCGSGRKYKKCHLAEDERGRATAAGAATLQDLDGRLVRALMRFAVERFDVAWDQVLHDLAGSEAAMELAAAWAVFGMHVEGRPVVDWYLDERGRRLAGAERAWLDAQRSAWLSVWEVTGVEPGATVTLHDLLTDERRVVRERTASRSLVVRDAVLARVVDGGSGSLLSGIHGRALPPLDAAEVVRRARGRLRRRTAVPPERLRDPGFARYLVRRWQEAVDDLDVRAAIPPDLRNTDGDPFLLTTDHFDVAPGARAAVEAALGGLEGVLPPGPGDDPPAWDFLRPGDGTARALQNTVLGRAWIADGRLHVETNSRARADALRGRIEAACGAWIRHRAREHADPLSAKAARGRPSPPPPPEAAALALELRRRHYAAWVDEPVPALGGKTPRESSRTAAGRRVLDALLKDIENRERRAAGGFDFSEIRRELGLD